MATIISNSTAETIQLAERIGKKLQGGEVIEVISDLGGGKTQFVKGLTQGMGSPDHVQSPTFTINRIYKNLAGLELHHFDFYRLHEPGVVAETLKEALVNPKTIVAIEWSQIVQNVLPADRLQVTITATGIESRTIIFLALGNKAKDLLKGIT